MAHKRVTLSLPPEVASDLDWLSDQLGISRSAIASDILADSFSGLVPVVEYYAAQDSDGGSPLSRRLRGGSADSIRADFAKLREMAASVELDPDRFQLTPPTDGEAG